MQTEIKKTPCFLRYTAQGVLNKKIGSIQCCVGIPKILSHHPLVGLGCNPIFTCYESILTLGHKSVFTRGRKSNFPAAGPGLTRSRLEGQEVWRLLRRLYTSQSIFQARDSGFECRVVTWRIKAPALITALTWKPAQESWRQFHLILHTFYICICIYKGA